MEITDGMRFLNEQRLLAFEELVLNMQVQSIALKNACEGASAALTLVFRDIELDAEYLDEILDNGDDAEALIRMGIAP